MNRRYVSTTDPDAAIVSTTMVKPRLRYKTHRAVDPAYEVITATEVTAGNVDESLLMGKLLERHRQNTGRSAKTVVGDGRYGTIANYLHCSDSGVRPHLKDVEKAKRRSKKYRGGMFAAEVFIYDKKKDRYICPAGKELKPCGIDNKRQRLVYSASKNDCGPCELRPKSAASKHRRSVKRHFRQEAVDRMRAIADSAVSKKDLRTRQHLMERTFACGVRYGFKRARWRRLWRVQIQEYITAAIQNINMLIRHGEKPPKAAATSVSPAKAGHAIIKNASWLADATRHYLKMARMIANPSATYESCR